MSVGFKVQTPTGAREFPEADHAGVDPTGRILVLTTDGPPTAEGAPTEEVLICFADGQWLYYSPLSCHWS